MTVLINRPVTAMNSSSDPRILGSVAMSGVAMAIWQRQPPPEYQAWLDGLDSAQLPRLRCRAALSQVPGAVLQACMEAGTPPCPQRETMIADIADLSRRAADVTKSLMVDLRLDAGNGQPCPKWHLDAVPARLLCTLRGAGTQFGPTRTGGEPTHIHQMRAGDVGMFRGRLWPGDEISGILHRSPPAETGQTRLLTVIDPVDEAGSC